MQRWMRLGTRRETLTRRAWAAWILPVTMCVGISSVAAADMPPGAEAVQAHAAVQVPPAPVRERIWDPGAGAWGVWEWDDTTGGWTLVEVVRPADGDESAPSPQRQAPRDEQATGDELATRDEPATGEAGSFVRRQGTDLVQGGRRLAGTGVNLFDAAAGPGWACEHASTQEELTAAFTELRAAGARVVRFWAFQSYTAGGTDWRGIDKVIAAAKASGMLLIPTLEDGPGWCTTGPTQQAKWQVPGYFSEGYRRPYGTARLSLLDYAGVIAARYKDEPAIAAWMIMNEAETSERSPDGRSALVAMSGAVAAAIKRADPHHLVTLGTQGNGAPGTSGRDFADIYAQPELDYAEVHDWPREGGSETAVLAGRSADGALPDPDSDQCRDLGAPVACSFAIARQLGKPLVVGELGVKTGTAGGPRQRAEAVAGKVRADLAAGAALVLLWEARLPKDGGGEGFDVRPGSGDPLLGVLAAGASAPPADPPRGQPIVNSVR